MEIKNRNIEILNKPKMQISNVLTNDPLTLTLSPEGRGNSFGLFFLFIQRSMLDVECSMFIFFLCSQSSALVAQPSSF